MAVLGVPDDASELGTAAVGGVVAPLVVAPPLGGWQVLDVVAVDVVAGAEVVAAPASIAAGLLLTVVGTVASTHFQTDGQSASEMQLATLAWQEPGRDEVVMHTGACAGSPFADGADPEHVPMVVG
jgi:hypothetical protein